MYSQNKDTRWLTGVALMAALIIVLASTPLGMIQLPIIRATTVHIPVIIGAAIFGPLAGAILGGVFGISSMITATFSPVLLSFAFSPFLSTTGVHGALSAIWISIGTRILIGVVAGWLFILLKKFKTKDFIALPIVGFVGSMTNTVLVLGSIYVLLANEFAAAREMSIDVVFSAIMAIVASAGIPEAIAAAVLVTVLGKVLLQLFHRQMGYNSYKNKQKSV